MAMEIVFGAVLGVVTTRIFKLAETYIRGIWKCRRTDEMEKELQKNLTEVKKFLGDAEPSEIKEARLVNWMSDVNNDIFDAEYLLRCCEYERLKNKVDEENPNKRQKLVNSAYKFVKTLFVPKNGLSDAVKKFHSLANEIRSDPGPAADIKRVLLGKRKRVRKETTGKPLGTKLFGMDKLQKDLLSLLQSSNEGEEKYSVVSIVGIGGVGKTTLAQSIYEHESLKDHFKVKAWVHVPCNCDVKTIMKRIVETAKMKKPANFYRCITLQDLQEVLIKGLESKRFLFVLDDVWEDMLYDQWETLSKSFERGSEGSKVLVTTRSRNIAKRMGAQDKSQIYLSSLQVDDCWKCIKLYAFKYGQNAEEDKELKEIGLKIAEKLGGLPLAAKEVGKQLFMNSNWDEWNNVLDTEAWKKNKTLMSSLKLSYDNLDDHLKKCFLYLSLFPKGYKYNSRTLAYIWATLNCVQSTDHENKRFVDIQREYAPDLVNRGLLTNDSSGVGEDEACYEIHNLLHDLAESIAGADVYRAENYESLTREPKCNVRHLYVESSKSVDSILKNIAPKQLRSLVYNCSQRDLVNGRKLKFSADTIRKIKGLHLLFLDFDQLNLQNDFEIENIGDLCHLRCIIINFGENNFVIPKSFWKLHQLEFLQTRQHDMENFNELHKLISLRYVHCPCSSNHPRMIITSYLGRLQSLEVVPGGKFIIDGKMGNDMGQLGGLDKIGGDLTLEVCARLGEEDAIKANLNRKQHLNQLSIIEGESGVIDAEGLEVLEPHGRLHTLNIMRCKSINKTPNWLRKLRNLKKLYLDSLPLVKHIIDVAAAPVDEFFPSLAYVKISNMKNLEGLCADTNQTTKHFSKLSEIEVYNCPKLLAGGSSKCNSSRECINVSLVLYEDFILARRLGAAEEEGEEDRRMIKIMIDWQSLQPAEQEISKLLKGVKELNITSGIQYLIGDNIFSAMFKSYSLEVLKFEEWNDLESLDRSKYNSITDILHPASSHIKKLIIRCCSNFKFLVSARNSLQTLFPSLEMLVIENCPQLESLECRPNIDCDNDISLVAYSSLMTLIIRHCSGLKFLSLSTMFPSLKTLIIQDCQSLVSFSEQNNTDNDDRLQVLPSSMNTLIIEDCNKLTLPAPTLQYMLQYSIQKVKIERCEEVQKSLRHAKKQRDGLHGASSSNHLTR